MKRNDAEQIGEMIRKFFRQNALEAPLNEYRLIQAWKDVVGPAITKYTSNLYIKNQILYVHLTSSVLRQELMMGRDLLVKNLNKQVGAQVIVNIIFRSQDGLLLFLWYPRSFLQYFLSGADFDGFFLSFS